MSHAVARNTPALSATMALTWQAHSEANKRILDQLAVLETFADSVTAMKRYAQRHHDLPDRELYVFHTGPETLDITERIWPGIRGTR